ncbi:XAP5, circadian clock regulator-domain-containing protein [Fimicolochytrium jonesii]|uniref:XAP5, circadian clock regulator-domain-containing protein n=1 Tax=Fimicolochytrium jonesii TaxID=1396493 RepID=UPI0022FEF999|nr:XAP5, circadian clock regulator-domain-containing protein [Fimicolochytrium jonesii]KAI8823605.1 XAP5, circadian clock regulator-domain-containing protein [Fimicolochytrium jonesii]
MAEYKGAGSEASRAAMLEKQRKNMIADFQSQKDRIAKEKQVHIGADKFVAQNDWVDNELKRQTVGLVQLEDFQRIRESLDKQRREEVERERDAALKNKRKKKKEKVKLSFDLDGEEETLEVEESGTLGDGDASSKMTTMTVPTKKIKKNPTVDTSFLPDREREEEERKEREKLKEEWLEQQEKTKKDKIIITYSYWDGTGHRKQVECRKGDTIGQFLENCRQQWHELRGVNVDNLMYVKEDLIVPHHYTFYDFIINKTRGKSGPLFSFDVHDDVRLISDATVETEESHAGKILERAWYEKNKHIFPASRWEVFDPQKDYGSYTVKDRNKEKGGEAA